MSGERPDQGEGASFKFPTETTEAEETKPKKLYRGVTINPAELSPERLRQLLVPGGVSKEDPTKIGDGNELGVYMSTNDKVADIYARGGTGRPNIDTEYYHDGYSVTKNIQLPSCGIVYEIDTNGIVVRRPEISSILQGVYNNGFEGEEWIADTIPLEQYKIAKLILSRFANDSEALEVKIKNSQNEDELNAAIEQIRKAYEEKKAKALEFKVFLETLPENKRLSGMFMKKWARENGVSLA